MNYAQTYHIGNDQAARTKKAKAVVPTVEPVRTMDAKTKRCQRGSERQTQVSTNGHAANGFLKISFLPKLNETATVQDSKKTAKTERDFYKSLSLLTEHYGIEPMQTKQFEYPYNMALAIWDIKEKLKKSVPNWDEICLVQHSKKTYFTSVEKYNTSTTLYYIPIEPLYQMLHDHRFKKNAHLLISICSYLYHIADIPYFRQEDSYLYWVYDMHKDWLEQEEDAEEIEASEREFRKVAFIGDCMQQKIFNRINLQVFERRLNAFKCRDTFDHECWQLAYKTLALYTEYPQASIFRNTPQNETDESGVIGMEKYISFISHTKGWLYDSIADTINSDFTEYGATEEPTIYKHFDGKELTKNNLDFENKLFNLLEDVCSLLNNYETTRK